MGLSHPVCVVALPNSNHTISQTSLEEGQDETDILDWSAGVLVGFLGALAVAEEEQRREAEELGRRSSLIANGEAATPRMQANPATWRECASLDYCIDRHPDIPESSAPDVAHGLCLVLLLLHSPFLSIIHACSVSFFPFFRLLGQLAGLD